MRYLLLLLSLPFFCGCSSLGASIIESISIPNQVRLSENPTTIQLESISKHTPFEDSDVMKVATVKVNGKGPLRFMVLFENGELDPEFVTGVLMKKALSKIGETQRPGKIHHAIRSFSTGGVTLENFAMEIYEPSESEKNSPLYYLDGALTSGMLKNLRVSLNDAKTALIVSQ